MFDFTYFFDILLLIYEINKNTISGVAGDIYI